MIKTHLEVQTLDRALLDAETLLLVGPQDQLSHISIQEILPPDVRPYWSKLVESAQPGDTGSTRETFRAEAPTRIVAAVLPTRSSRHNAPGRPDALKAMVEAKLPSTGEVAIVLCLAHADQALAAVSAVAKAVPTFSRKSKSSAERCVRVAILPAQGSIEDAQLDALQIVAEGVRFAAQLVDQPPNELDTEAFIDVARQAAVRVGAEITVISGEQVLAAGLGGLWGVGKAAESGPALVILEHTRGTGPRVSLVGKGIVYDTGGLSIKGKSNMPGMKTDMGGAAAVLGAFVAALRAGTDLRLSCVLCLAENSVGPKSTRNDDILTLYSGKTVEVNNTDAEGRLVLGDGVAWATRQLKSEVIIDLATLTGAQLVATGRLHAAAVSNDEALEQLSVEAGRASGDLVWPLPYAPELFRKEFSSKVADLKNSVRDRMNAQSSCAAQFIAEHLGDFEGRWLHLDIAGPAVDKDRGTGYGVALLSYLLPRLGA